MTLMNNRIGRGDVTVYTEEYEKLLQSISAYIYIKITVLTSKTIINQVCQILSGIMVDLLDFPCSIWPGIVDIIGTDRPIIIVGNKVDCCLVIVMDILKRVKHSANTEINKTKLGEAKIRYISLISAKTGYGVEDLISAMFKEWLGKGNVYLGAAQMWAKAHFSMPLLQSDILRYML
ncbi:hypothetical protein evm_014480 [Chilo suppressalis]|nr:hypothetical protein evm_014480 [Chilo suppressalis]